MLAGSCQPLPPRRHAVWLSECLLTGCGVHDLGPCKSASEGLGLMTSSCALPIFPNYSGRFKTCEAGNPATGRGDRGEECGVLA